ncbi:MAG: thioredoxin family protein [Alphaproteobacteria bacterium]|nr:thioredoxin family protein [Alphaproteobacteria bacterium]
MPRFLPLLLLLLALTPVGVQAAAPKVQARLISETASVMPGGRLAVALEEEIRPGWHTYWQNPGAAGMPTSLSWALPKGWQASPLEWPYPQRFVTGPLIDYGYAHKVWLLTSIAAPSTVRPGTLVTLRAHAQWLVCKEICIPEEADLTLPVSISATRPAPYATIAAQFAAARARLPGPSPWTVHYGRRGTRLVLYIAAPDLAAAGPRTALFVPSVGGQIVATAPQELLRLRQGIALQIEAHPQQKGPLQGVLELTDAGGTIKALAINAPQGPVPASAFSRRAPQSLAFVLLLAFVGGLILNLMPCVLPVLAIKILAVAESARVHRTRATMQGLAYGIGALLGFVGLGAGAVLLRAGGFAVGWGFQLQQPVFVAAFALLLFAVGLNLSGVIELGQGFGGGTALAGRKDTWGAFFTGLLAVAVAAPCTAPFMAAALGFALTQNAGVAMLVFAALGFGFAAPFVVIAIAPRWRGWLPRPGIWMVRLREALAFPMYGASAWLLWVLAQEAGATPLITTLGAMIVLAFAAWAYSSSRQAKPLWRHTGTVVSVLALAAALGGLGLVYGGARTRSDTGVTAAAGLDAQAYTPARLAQLRRSGRPVFVDATAAWCITCMVNEKLALEAPSVQRAFHRRHVAYLVADWTNRNPQISALLEAHGRAGVPLYLYYGPGAARAQVLPQILTPQDLVGMLATPAQPG